MGGSPSLASAVILALLPPNEEAKKQTKPTTGNAIVEKATVTTKSDLRAFLRMNPEEEFDIEAINSIDMHHLIKETQGDKRWLRAAVGVAGALLPRVRAETEDPILVGAILADKTLAWYTKSGADPDWAEFTPLRWGGIFYESRAPGGRLRRKLSQRLVDLINECVNASGTTAVLRAGFGGMFRGSKQVKSAVQFALGSKRPRLTQQVAQAYLDDLAACPRKGDATVPLEHLSALARRADSVEVNNTLSELFRPRDSRFLTVIDERFHPGMGAVGIRVVPAKTSDEGSTYDLVLTGTTAGPEAHAAGAAIEVSTNPWDRAGMTDKEWIKLLKALEKKKTRLEAPPPENHRDREAYVSLRELVITDASARKAFATVHWKGRPQGLVLLSQLLSQGVWIPEIDTDADYLEAELDHLHRHETGHAPTDTGWSIGHGWSVTREIRPGAVRSYTARAPSST